MAGSLSSSANPSGVQGVCPAGWHLPSHDEWTQLENYLADNGFNYDSTIGGGRDKIAKSMAATTLWNTSSNTGAIGNNLLTNNSSGFSGLPGGYRYYVGTFSTIGYTGYWWSSSEYSKVAFRYLNYNYARVYSNISIKGSGFNVRCLRD